MPGVSGKTRSFAKAYAAEDHFGEDEEGDDAEADETADLAEESECGSDAGASGDDEVFTAYSVFKEARKKLQTMQKQRGFFHASGEISFDERKAAIRKEKERSRCGACGLIGHWPETMSARRNLLLANKGL